MRCFTARRRLSDELDGALRPGRKLRLEAHLQTCPACRAYGRGLARIQAHGRPAGERAPEEWTSFERSLEARLDALEPGARPVPRPFAVRPRWAWAVPAAMVLAAAAAWYALGPSGTPAVETWAGYDDVLDPLMAAAEADGDLAGRIDREVGVMIDEMAPAPDAEAVVLRAADPLFWEGLSDDDLRAIISGLEQETGNGGPA
jgi:anti-sigma factor RsiW